MKSRSIYLAAALESIESIQTYIAGYSVTMFLADKKTQDAVIRNLEIIGQALKDFGVNALLEIDPKIPWHEITGMRNVLAHDYMGVDMLMVWETVQSQIEPLKRVLETSLAMKGRALH